MSDITENSTKRVPAAPTKNKTNRVSGAITENTTLRVSGAVTENKTKRVLQALSPGVDHWGKSWGEYLLGNAWGGSWVVLGGKTAVTERLIKTPDDSNATKRVG